MRKILFFIPGLSEGGAEKVLCNLVNNMDKSKFDITVQTVYKFDYTKYLSEGIRYKYLFNSRKGFWGKLINYWYRFCTEFGLTYSLYIKDKYDIEVAYLECGATKVIASSNNRAACKIAWVHCDLSKKTGMRKSVSKVKKQYQKYDKIVCVSKDAERGFQDLYGCDYPTMVLRNVLDEDEIIVKSNQKIDRVYNKATFQLLAVGRLTQQKNFSHLLDVCHGLCSRDIDFHMDILGEGPEHKLLEDKIRDLHLCSYVTLQGFIANPYPWIKKSDLIVCSSRYEGISTVIQEAMILGKPVVTTPCTGMSELLGDSEYGLIADDSENGLLQAIEDLLADPLLLEKYKCQAQKRGKTFLKKYVLEETEALFETECQRKSVEE